MAGAEETTAGFFAYVRDAVRRFSMLGWLFVLGGSAALASVLAGLGYTVMRDGQLPRVSLYALEEGQRYFAAGDTRGALREAEAAVAIAPADTQHLYSLGAAAFGTGDRPRAAEAFARVLQYDANHPEANYSLGIIYLQDNQLDEAIRLLQRAANAESGPRAARAWNNLGVAYARNGQQELAADCYLRAVQLDPGFTDARRNLQRLTRRPAGGA